MPTPSRSPIERAAPLLLVLATLFWGSNFIVGRLLGQELTPLALNFWRWLGALVFLLPLSGAELLRQRRLLLAHWRLIGILGLTGIAIYNCFIYAALRATTALNAALFLALLPLAIMLAARIIDGEPIRRGQLPGMALSLLGATVVITRGDLASLLNMRLNAGDLWMLAAIPLWAVYAVLQRRRPAGLSPLALTSASIFVGVLALTPVYLLERAGGTATPIMLPAALGLAYLAAGPSAIGYVLWNRGLAVLGASRAGVFINLIPVFSALLGVTLLREVLEPYHLAGAALVATGVALASRHRAAPVVAAVPPTPPADQPELRSFLDGSAQVYTQRLAEALPWLEGEALMRMRRLLRVYRYSAGEPIIRQGEPADRLYIVARGEVEVLQEEAGRLVSLARLGPGQHFGELGLLWGSRRLATVHAATDAELLGLDREAFQALFTGSSAARAALLRRMRFRVAAELRHNDQEVGAQ